MGKFQEKSSFYGWKNTVFLFFIMYSAGIVFYSISIIFPAMIKDLEWTRGPASLALTINILIMGFLAPIIAISINKYGNKKTLIFGWIAVVVTMILLGTVIRQLWIWTVLWGIIAPIGMAFCGFIPVITNVMLWFNVRRATVLGIVMTGFALGGFITQPLYTWLMGVTGSYQIGWFVNATAGCIALALTFFIIEKPEDLGQHPDGLDPEDMDSTSAGKLTAPRTYRSSVNWPLKAVFKTPSIWFLMAVNTGFMQALFLITSHGVLHFTDIGFTSMQAASVLSFIIMSSGIAGLPMGMLADRIEPRWITSVAMIAMLLMFLGLWKVPNMGFLMAVGPVFGFCYGTVGIMLTTIMGNYYGPEAFPKINGVLAPIGTVTSAIIPVAAGVIADRTGSYDLVFIFISFVLLGGFICAILIKPPTPRFDV